jgi:hypothetical protein
MFKNDKWLEVKFIIVAFTMVATSWAVVLGAVHIWDKHTAKVADSAAICQALQNGDVDNAKFFALYGTDEDNSPNRSVRDANVLLYKASRLDVCQPR